MKSLFTLTAPLTLSLIVACINIPIQATRNVQVENYVQEYDFADYDSASKAFQEILGPNNLRQFTEIEWASYLGRAKQNRLKVRGQITLTVSLYPWDSRSSRRSFVEGVGHYMVVDETAEPDGGKNEELIASSDFYVIDSAPSAIRGFGAPFLALIRQHVVREFRPDKPRYVHESTLAIQVYLHKIKEEVYTIDYCRYHDLGVVKNLEQSSGEVLWSGCLWFDHPTDGRKLIDLSGVDSRLVRDDYREALQEQGFVEGGIKPRLWWKNGPTCGNRLPPPGSQCRKPLPK